MTTPFQPASTPYLGANSAGAFGQRDNGNSITWTGLKKSAVQPLEAGQFSRPRHFAALSTTVD